MQLIQVEKQKELEQSDDMLKNWLELGYEMQKSASHFLWNSLSGELQAELEKHDPTGLFSRPEAKKENLIA